MFCTIRESLGAKGWYWETSVQAKWKGSREISTTDQDEVWQLDDVATLSSLISKSKKYGITEDSTGQIKKKSAFAKVVTGRSKDPEAPNRYTKNTKNTTVFMASRACFMHDKFGGSPEIGISGGYDAGPVITHVARKE
ncbi:hypothetical protein [Nonomuraea sp. NPDC050691]|uniref:hypothetical protein n=1 Tax=Nonomuraea sp. NPDC050691 TaxID=3155661 RepID=UPI0033C3ADC2